MSQKDNSSSPKKQDETPTERDTRVRVNVRVPSRLMKIIKEEAIYNDRSVSSLVIEALWEKYRKDSE